MERLFITIFFTALSLISFFSYAVPSKNITKEFVQPDGTTLNLTLIGNEQVHFYITADNIPVFEAPDGSFRYGDFENGVLKVSEVLAHEINQRMDSETVYVALREEVLNYLRDISRKKISEVNEIRTSKRMSRAPLGQFNEYKGDFRGLVILVEFPDLKMSSEYSQLDFLRMFNGKGYSDNGALGSVSDYFRDQSYGQFNLMFDIVGPLMMEKQYAYYGSNDPISGNDKHVQDLVREACTLADASINYTDYDWDHDGEVDQVFIIYSGYGEHAGAPANTIWPHEHTVSSLGLEFDGVKIGTYACSCELAGNRGTVLAGIGTPCHEFSHCLGFPDLYDTDYSGAFGMDYWDLMDSGAHSGPEGNGEVPYGFSAYERWVAGWLKPIEITESSFGLKIRDLEHYPEAYILYNDNNHNEFYLIENHQPTKWFTYVGKYKDIHGMMVSHVNYDAKAWATNRVNPTPEKQGFSIIPADNEYGKTEESYRNDLFPGPMQVITLDDTSHIGTGGFLYNLSVYNDFKLHKCITEIEENERGEITFGIFYNDRFSAPLVNSPEDIDETGFLVSWTQVEEADHYIVEQKSTDPNSIFPIPRTWRSEPLTDTSIRLDWLHNEYADTRVRVMAVSHGVKSEWSDYITIETPNTVENINSDDEEILGIYYSNGIQYNQLQKGINIIITSKGSRKVHVK